MKKEKEIEPQLEINKVEEMEVPAPNPINKPTEKEIEGAKLELEKAQKEWSEGLWDIGTAEKGQEHIDYLKHYINHRFLWTQNAWMGVIRLMNELDTCQAIYAGDTSVPPRMGSQAIEFILFAFQNSGGTGLQAAKDFEAENELYAEMFDIVGKSVEKARKKLEDIKFLTDKYAAYQQGFYYEREPTNEEMEGAYFDEELNRFVKPGEKEYDIKIFMKKVEEEYGEETAKKVAEELEKEKEKESIGPPIEK